MGLVEPCPNPYDDAVFVRKLDDAEWDDVADESVALLADVPDVVADVADPLFCTNAVVAL